MHFRDFHTRHTGSRGNGHDPESGEEEQDDLPLRQLQYMIAWIAREKGLAGVSVPDDATGLSIAVVGGGPAGSTAAEISSTS